MRYLINDYFKAQLKAGTDHKSLPAMTSHVTAFVTQFIVYCSVVMDNFDGQFGSRPNQVPIDSI